VCSAQIGPGGRLNTYTECTALPTFANAMFPRLYDDKSRERYAFTNIGRVLTAKIIVDAAPATNGMFSVVIVGR
jgi:hypothetical protein